MFSYTNNILADIIWFHTNQSTNQLFTAILNNTGNPQT